MTTQIYVTDKIKEDLDRLKRENQITEEGLASVILREALSDDQKIQRIVKFMKRADLGGAESLEKKGW